MSNLLTSALSVIRSTYAKGARFASILYTAKGSGEVARHVVCLGVSIERAYRRDLATLLAKRETMFDHYYNIIAPIAQLEAIDELIGSLRESLTVGVGNNSAYTCRDTYVNLATGIKAHATTGELYVTGFAIGKTVLSAGVHKVVKSSAKTIAKKALRRTMKSGKFRQFALDAATAIKADGKVLVFLPPVPTPTVSPVGPFVPSVAPAMASIRAALV